MAPFFFTSLSTLWPKRAGSAPPYSAFVDGPSPPTRRLLLFFAEEFDVFGAFLKWASVAALHQFANLRDDIRIGERGDVAGVHVIGDGREDSAHDFAGTRFGHVGNDVDALRPGDLADNGFDGGDDFVLHGFAWKHAGLQGNVNFRDTAFDFVNDGDDGGFGDFGDAQAGRFDFLGAEAVTGDVDDVIHAAQDTVVAIGGKHGAVGGVIGPIVPVFALRILAILFVVLMDEAL